MGVWLKFWSPFTEITVTTCVGNSEVYDQTEARASFACTSTLFLLDKVTLMQKQTQRYVRGMVINGWLVRGKHSSIDFLQESSLQKTIAHILDRFNPSKGMLNSPSL